MSTHHTKTKEERTAALLKKALGLLINSKSTITLNGKNHKKISFSQRQVIDAINQVASYEDRLDGIIIKDPSTISKNKNYTALIAEAKEKRKDLEMEAMGKNSYTGDIEYDFFQLTQEHEALQYKYDRLNHNYLALEDMIKQIKLKDNLYETIDPSTGEFLSQEDASATLPYNSLHKHILIQLLESVTSDALRIVSEKPERGKQGQVYYRDNKLISHKICNFNELEQLNLPEELMVKLRGEN